MLNLLPKRMPQLWTTISHERVSYTLCTYSKRRERTVNERGENVKLTRATMTKVIGLKFLKCPVSIYPHVMVIWNKVLSMTQNYLRCSFYESNLKSFAKYTFNDVGTTVILLYDVVVMSIARKTQLGGFYFYVY